MKKVIEKHVEKIIFEKKKYEKTPKFIPFEEMYGDIHKMCAKIAFKSLHKSGITYCSKITIEREFCDGSSAGESYRFAFVLLKSRRLNKPYSGTLEQFEKLLRHSLSMKN